MTYRVRFTDEAREDLYELHEFLASENPRAANDALATIERALGLLELFPYACRAASGSDSTRIRELVIQFGRRGYVALFEIEPDDVVTIIAVRHQRESDYH
ncbi:MAG: type II toxin-antitoxin system RelE/ParE family toxin [Archangium sp.]